MKDALPWEIKQECLWIVRGYKRRVRLYHEWRQDVIEETGSGYVTYTHRSERKNKNGETVVTKEERRQCFRGSGEASRTVEDKQSRLEAIEHYPETKKMRAVEYAKLRIGLDVMNDELRQRLTDGILLNCENGKDYPFRYLNLSELSQRDFYRRKDKFLRDIALYLDMT